MKEFKVIVGYEEYNGSGYTCREFEYLLIEIYKNLMPLWKGNAKSQAKIKIVKESISEMTKRLTGRRIEEAMEVNDVIGIDIEIVKQKPLSVVEFVEFFNQIPQIFKLSMYTHSDELNYLVNIAFVIQWMLENSGFGESEVTTNCNLKENLINYRIPSYRDKTTLLSITIKNLQFQRYYEIKQFLTEEQSKIYRKIENRFGFVYAWEIFYEYLPEVASSSLTIKHWVVIKDNVDKGGSLYEKALAEVHKQVGL